MPKSVRSVRRLIAAGLGALMLGLCCPGGWAQSPPPTHLEEAVLRAKAADKPILIWLTARWSGESEAMRINTMNQAAVREALARDLVVLEVDRDEEPGLDAALQACFAAINGRAGGYPLTVFCTPEGDPVEALGYVPAESGADGTGLVDISGKVAGLWKSDRERMVAQGAMLRDRVLLPPASGTGRSVTLGKGLIEDLARNLSGRVTTSGLVRVGGEAVPLPAVGIMLAAVGQGLENKASADGSDRMLNGALRGPLRDHIMGGYNRSAVVGPGGARVQPEKLLSVQAAWLRAFAAGHMQSPRGRYVEACEEILRLTPSQMDIAGGGWKAYLAGMTHLPVNRNPWFFSVEDVRATPGLAERDGNVMVRYLGLESGRRGVAMPVSLLEPVGRALNMSYDAANSALIRGRGIVAAHRQQEGDFPRASNLRILQWEGAAITSYILAARVTNRPALQEHALATARRIATTDVGPDGTIPRMVLDGNAVVPGTYGDYAQVAEALLNCHAVTGEGVFLEKGRAVLQQGERLREPGDTTGTLALRRGGNRLFHSHDGELPSPLSVAAAAWMILDTVEPGKGSMDRARARIQEILEETRRGGAEEVAPAEAGAGWTLMAMLSSLGEL